MFCLNCSTCRWVFFDVIVQEGHCHILLLPSWSFFLLVKTFDSVFILVTHLSTDHISIGPIIALPHKVNTRILHTYASAFQCLSEFIKCRVTTYIWILRCKSVVLIQCMKMRNPRTEEGFPRLSVTLFLSPGFFSFVFGHIFSTWKFPDQSSKWAAVAAYTISAAMQDL